MPTANPQHIYIYDHPESKIRFLETSLVGEDWRATVVFPAKDAQAAANLDETRQQLTKRGYTVAEGTDDHGNATLDIHHLGAHGAVADVFREAGLVRGTAHALLHPGDSLRTVIAHGKAAGNWLEGALHDPARANGVVNTTAEGFLIAAGAGAKYGKFTDTKNALQSLAGLSWLSQSLIYLGFARNNEDRASRIITKKIDQVSAAGGDITAIAFDRSHDFEPEGWKHRAEAFVHHYPVTIGAVMNNVGMGAYIAHALLEKKDNVARLLHDPHNARALSYVGTGKKGFSHWAKTGFGQDIIGASLSLVGWSLLMIPPKKPTMEADKDPQRGTLGNTWDWMREHTPLEAGLFTLGASSFRLMGAHSKENKLQKIGESIYLGGDLALMATNSHEYGGDAKLNQAKLSDAIVEHVGKIPVLMGSKEQERFVDHTMKFWLDKYNADSARDRKDPATYKQWIESNAIEVKKEVMRKIRHQQTERLEHIVETVAEMIGRFSEAKHSEITDALVQTLSTRPWMRVAPEELKAGITAALPRVLKTNPELSVHTEKAVANDVHQITAVVPHINIALETAVIYDALAPYLQAQKATPKHVVSNVEHQAPLRMAAAAQL